MEPQKLTLFRHQLKHEIFREPLSVARHVAFDAGREWP
jgi:hypothetical protein